MRSMIFVTKPRLKSRGVSVAGAKQNFRNSVVNFIHNLMKVF